MNDSEYYARIRKYGHVSSSSKFVCTGETNGSYNYSLRDEVYPTDKKYIPVKNIFGSIDYLPNSNYRSKK